MSATPALGYQSSQAGRLGNPALPRAAPDLPATPCSREGVRPVGPGAVAPGSKESIRRGGAGSGSEPGIGTDVATRQVPGGSAMSAIHVLNRDRRGVARAFVRCPRANALSGGSEQQCTIVQRSAQRLRCAVTTAGQHGTPDPTGLPPRATVHGTRAERPHSRALHGHQHARAWLGPLLVRRPHGSESAGWWRCARSSFSSPGTRSATSPASCDRSGMAPPATSSPTRPTPIVASALMATSGKSRRGRSKAAGGARRGR